MKKILIIEDDQVVGNVFYNHLMAEGYHVRSVPDGESGLSTMQDFKADIILLDLILPHMSGLEVIKQIRSEEEFLKTPILVFTNAYLTGPDSRSVESRRDQNASPSRIARPKSWLK